MKHAMFGPRDTDAAPDYPPCPACGKPFRAGDYTTLVPIGPGDDEDARERAASGRAYNAVAVEAHYACVTGRTP